MEKVREMNASVFHDNLMLTIYEVLNTRSVDESKLRFKIIPVYEKDKPHNARDDVMRLVLLSEKNVGNRLLNVKETVKLVACMSPFVPIWIHISFAKTDGEKLIFNFETSLRLRKPSLLRNAETGHPPFKAIT